ncbi:hypothetical protein BJX62DRAFT_240310 [Aspergillus germanicus]
MAHTPVHPSQRRVACELCRRHKSKCQRIHRNDPKCSRCMILGAECLAGQQKKVGRPKHLAGTARGAPRDPGFMSGPDANTAFRKRGHDQHQERDELLSPGLAQGSECLEYNLNPPPVAVAAADGCSVPRIWPAPGIETIQQAPMIPIISTFGGDEFPMVDFDSASNLATSNIHSPELDANPPYRTARTLERTKYESSPGDSASTGAIAKLSQINLDLHIRLAAAEKYRAMLDLNTIVYPEGPLFIEDYTLAEFVLKASEDFSQILTRLCAAQGSRPSHTLTTSSSPSVSANPLPAPLALTITSIFLQVMSLYEFVLDHLITRIERLPNDPLVPIRTIKFKGLLQPDKPCVQGMIFSNAIVALLEEMEVALGTKEMRDRGGICLLSARQADVLSSELEGRVGVISRDGGGAMRPADVKQLFRKAATVLCEYSLRE